MKPALPQFLSAHGEIIEATVVRTEAKMYAIYQRNATIIADYARSHPGRRILVVATLEAASHSLNSIFYHINSSHTDIASRITRSEIWPGGGGSLGESELRLIEDCPIPFDGELVIIYDCLRDNGRTARFLNDRKWRHVSPSNRPDELNFLFALERSGTVSADTPQSLGGQAEMIYTEDYLFGCGLDWGKRSNGSRELDEGDILYAAPKGARYLPPTDKSRLQLA